MPSSEISITPTKPTMIPLNTFLKHTQCWFFIVLLTTTVFGSFDGYFST